MYHVATYSTKNFIALPFGRTTSLGAFRFSRHLSSGALSSSNNPRCDPDTITENCRSNKSRPSGPDAPVETLTGYCQLPRRFYIGQTKLLRIKSDFLPSILSILWSFASLFGLRHMYKGDTYGLMEPVVCARPGLVHIQNQWDGADTFPGMAPEHRL